jgi:hypothetical protein
METRKRRWENITTGKSGYSPVCGNEWVRGICGKPQVKCGECPNQAFTPFGGDAIRSHLTGRAPGSPKDFTAGVYPMLPDETCWFLAANFDKRSWMQDVAAFRDTALAKGVPVAIEQVALRQRCPRLEIEGRRRSTLPANTTRQRTTDQPRKLQKVTPERTFAGPIFERKRAFAPFERGAGLRRARLRGGLPVNGTLTETGPGDCEPGAGFLVVF